MQSPPDMHFFVKISKVKANISLCLQQILQVKISIFFSIFLILKAKKYIVIKRFLLGVNS